MVWDFDLEMLFYLAIITVGFFIAPLGSDQPYYLVSGLVLIVVGFGLVYRKVKKK